MTNAQPIKINVPEAYPGSEMSGGQMLALAHEYRRIAVSLDKLQLRNRPITVAPYRFAAIHSIELYLNSFLLFKGIEARAVRELNHDLVRRRELAHDLGLVLRKKTIERIDQIFLNREYLAARYSIAHMKRGLEFAQVEVVMQEIAGKVTKKICNQK